MRPMPGDLSEPHACPPAPRRVAGSGDAIAATPHIRRGNELRKLDRHEEALESYDKAIALNPA